jgi:site-specific DNA-adenine methylase
MSKLNHFFISYSGNKRKECETIYEEIRDLLDGSMIDTIIEPYCGTSAISYFISHNYPNKFKYILNDNDEHLIKMYEIFKDPEQLDIFIQQLNEATTSLDKDKYAVLIRQTTEPHLAWFIKHKIYCIRQGLFPLNYKQKSFDKLKDTPIISFLRSEDIITSVRDGIDVVEQYKDDERVLIILDPPYLELNNSFYENSNTNIYEYYYKNSISGMKSKTLLILNNIWIIRLLFKDHIKSQYNKMYQPNKRKVEHLIIKNF